MPKRNIRKKVGQIVKELRISYGYTQETLAEKINLQTRAISQIENGNAFISHDTLISLSDTFGVPEKYFFDFNRPHGMQTDIERINSIVEDLKTLNSEKLKLSQNIIKNISLSRLK